MVRRVRVQPPAAGHLAQLDAALLALQLLAQVHQRLLDQLWVGLQHVGKLDDADSPTDVSASSPSSKSSPEPSMYSMSMSPNSRLCSTRTMERLYSSSTAKNVTTTSGVAASLAINCEKRSCLRLRMR